MASIMQIGSNSTQTPTTPQIPFRNDTAMLTSLETPTLAKPATPFNTPTRKIMNIGANRSCPQISSPARATEGPLAIFSIPSSSASIHMANASSTSSSFTSLDQIPISTPSKRKRISLRPVTTSDGSDDDELPATRLFTPRNLTYAGEDEMETTDEDVQKGKRRRLAAVDSLNPLEGVMDRLSIEGEDGLQDAVVNKNKISSQSLGENTSTCTSDSRGTTRRRTRRALNQRQTNTAIDSNRKRTITAIGATNSPKDDNSKDTAMEEEEIEDTIRVMIPTVTKSSITEHDSFNNSPRCHQPQPRRQRLRSPPFIRPVDPDGEYEEPSQPSKHDTDKVAAENFGDDSSNGNDEDDYEDLCNGSANNKRDALYFRLTAAQKYTRIQRRLKQIQEYKTRELREAREKRSRERRMRSVAGNLETSNTMAKITKKKVVHFAI